MREEWKQHDLQGKAKAPRGKGGEVNTRGEVNTPGETKALSETELLALVEFKKSIVQVSELAKVWGEAERKRAEAYDRVLLRLEEEHRKRLRILVGICALMGLVLIGAIAISAMGFN